MTLAAAYGLTPQGVDALTLRDCAVMVLAAQDRKRDEVRMVGLVLDGLYNYSWRAMQGGKTISFGHHGRELLGESAPERTIDAETRKRLRDKALAHKAQRQALGLA